MDRNVGGKIIHAAWADTKIFPEGVTADDLWESLTEEAKERYRIQSDALYNELIKAFEGSVLHFEDGKPQQIMTSGELQRITAYLSENQRYSSQRNGDLASLISNAIYYLKDKESKSLAKLKYFQDDILLYLRAIALVADGCSGEGITHRQKNERFKLLISSIESAIQKVADGYDSLLTHYSYQKPDLFRSDYPVIRYLEKIKDLENEVRKLKGDEREECPFGGDDF